LSPSGYLVDDVTDDFKHKGDLLDDTRLIYK
jgi:hypothetical protein